MWLGLPTLKCPALETNKYYVVMHLKCLYPTSLVENVPHLVMNSAAGLMAIILYTVLIKVEAYLDQFVCVCSKNRVYRDRFVLVCV